MGRIAFGKCGRILLLSKTNNGPNMDGFSLLESCSYQERVGSPMAADLQALQPSGEIRHNAHRYVLRG